MSSKTNTFELFRYQILPVDRYFQGDFFNGVHNVEELIKHKNKFFAQALLGQSDFSNKRHKTVVKQLLHHGDFYLYRIAHNKTLHRETRDFKDETIDSWPSILVAIWNHPDKQYIAVQKRTTAFAKCETVAKLILEKIEPQLTHFQLRAIYEPLFEKQQFWTLLRKYRGKVKSVDFEIITPNMANISGTLPDDLKLFAKCTNSTRNNLKIESEPDSALHLEEDNSALRGLVDYSSEGGGNISLKIDGIKKHHQTSRTVKEISLGEMELTGNAEQIAQVLKELLK
ncbi:hypothetical protein [Pseudoalteromonas lipolytica]|uniref:hypothetical protein n=1 Tax=Pseudoalteromonas lipolytica TaxID=570156 RepID=UPI00241EAB70|nr:hypothetical protein [Pseudoalteromonas lipolytica]|tara:strand:- start:264 stop:1115 length:852 start_codon:yes stop_codon:yes gene_type:complete